jgi:hypothetical protein
VITTVTIPNAADVVLGMRATIVAVHAPNCGKVPSLPCTGGGSPRRYSPGMSTPDSPYNL